MVLEILFQEKCLFNSSSGLTALHYAARSGNIECAQILLESGCQVNAMSNSGATPLHRAAYMGHTDIIQLLIGENFIAILFIYVAVAVVKGQQFTGLEII